MPLSHFRSQSANLIDRLANALTPAVAIGALAIHVFTAVTAFELWNGGPIRYWAAAAAWALPGISEAVVAYQTWQATGSRVNYYTVWMVAWLGLVLAVALLRVMARRLDRQG